MYIYLPDGFILFPKIWGEFVKSIVTSINGYFLVTVSENVCVHCFFYISLGFWFCLFVLFLGLNIAWFFLKSSLWPMTFSTRYYFHSAF